jgi:Salmonella virulence plasmid 65kDa B protein
MFGKTDDVPLRGLEWSRLDRGILIVVTIALFMLIAPSVRADPTSVPGEMAEGVFGEGNTGHGQPDNKTGAMTWTYPFNLPVARGQPQPRLTLSYNSSSHDREAGYGWGLDLPVIEFKPLSGNPCFEINGAPIACWRQNLHDPHLNLADPLVSGERYTYNGQSLVFICQLPGSQKDCNPDRGTEPQPDLASSGWASSRNWRYFRLQVEGQFSRFYLSEDRRYWRVQLKGGELLEFGEPPNSGILGTEHPLENNNAVLRWRLVRHSDAVHKVSGAPVNYIDYRWKPLGKRGLLYLTDIFDTPRANGRGREHAMVGYRTA